MKYFLPLLFACLFISNATTQAQNFANQSVLRQGNWIKVGTTQRGIYKMDYNFLKNAGMDIDNINPQNIQLYGNVGGMLPQANDAVRIDDLRENAIWVAGQEDGKFDVGDYILFYAQGAISWSYDATQKHFKHTQNVYSDSVYTFVTVGTTAGKRVQPQNSVGGASQILGIFDDYQVYEKDERVVLAQGSGREWYGELFDFDTEKSFAFDTPGLVNGTPISITSFVMGRSALDTRFSVSVNGVALGQQSIAAQPQGTYDIKGRDQITDFTINSQQVSSNQQLNIALNYDKNNGNSVGYLNYLCLNYQRTLQLYGQQTTFRAIASLDQPVTNFSIGNVSNGTTIWDLTDPFTPAAQQYQLNGNQAVFGANTTTLKEFVAFQGTDFPLPESVTPISNQNLHALAPTNLVIVTPEAFASQAERLADFRRTHDGLTVSVVNVQQIYNEFASGKQDITAIRDFGRMLYLRSPQTFRYLLLFVFFEVFPAGN